MDNLPRRAPVRVDTQDGPWSVSVAENPHDARAYSLYIKTPTLNLTLTRTAMEILDLDAKLRDSNSQAKIPPLPFNADSLPQPPKRKSTFLNTLSRLASPASGKTSRRNTNPPSSMLPTPIASPTGEINDPFTSFSASNVNSPSVVATPSATSTGLAAYLTTISNTPTLRQTRVWKRFVRVRTDDLESVRPEKAIKRVRSDLAAHVGGLPGREDELGQEALVPGNDRSLSTELDGAVEDSLPTPVQSPKELDLDDADDVPVQPTEHAKPDAIKDLVEDEVKKNQEPSAGTPTVAATTTTALQSATISGAEPPATTVAPEDIPVPTTPTASETQEQAQAQAAAAASAAPAQQQQQQRIHRSQSADPDKSSRLSRAFAQSAPAANATATPEMDGGASSATGDESSVSTSNPKRKKRSKSTTTPREKKYKEPKKSQRKVVINDFEMMRVLGKGCAGKVLLVRHKQTTDLYALKAITKRHVLAHQELQHTLTEQAVLKRMAAEGKDPFVVKLWWSFHDKENLFLVMDFHPGGDLATQLARWGRLGRDRARFYAAEIVEGVEGLHAAGVIYRDLKPENILIGSDGHIVLTDFGLSKEFPRRLSPGGTSAPMTPQTEITASAAWMTNGSPGTNGVTGLSASVGAGAVMMGNINGSGEQVVAGVWPGQNAGPQDQTTTFCGTAEYLAPEVIQGLPYSYEVDWWSFGTMLYEMLTGITPFWANNHSDMYVRVLQDELQFPEDRAIDQDTKSLIRGLLQRNPGLRICEPRIKRHPYFSMIDWSHVYYKRYIPPYIPPIDPSNASDTQNFDDTFLDMEPVLDEYVDDTDQDQAEGTGGQTTDMETDVDVDGNTDTDRTGTDDGGDEDTATTPSQSRSSSIRPGPGQSQISVQVQGSGVAGIGAGGGGVGGGGGQGQQQKPVEESVDVFDGYSFKGRHSVLIESSDEDEEEEGDEDEEDEIDDEEGSGSERTGTTGMTTNTTTSTTSATASEIGDDGSSVIRSVVAASPLETARPDSERSTSIEEEEEEEEVPEPKTPEARPHIVLQPASASAPATTKVVGVVDDVEDIDIQRLMADAKELEHKLEEGEPKTPTDDKSKGKNVLPAVVDLSLSKPSVSSIAAQAQQAAQKSVNLRPAATNKTKRRERSGIPALDKDLPEDTEAGEDTEAARGLDDDDDMDDDWDFIDVVDGEDRNGAKGTSLFARGVVDRYRLAVFRKASTPSRSQQQQRERQEQQQRSVSGTSKASTNGGSESPTQKRGRAALAFTRKGPRQFLQPKIGNSGDKKNASTPTRATPPPPPSSYSSKKTKRSFGPGSATTLLNSSSGSPTSSPHARSSTTTAVSPVVTSSSAAGMLTPSLSMGSSAMMSLSPSLRSRESAVSVGGGESDQSLGAGGLNGLNGGDTVQAQHGLVYSPGMVDEGVSASGSNGGNGGEKTKTTKKLKKYKEGAEKVFSLFSVTSSPRS